MHARHQRPISLKVSLIYFSLGTLPTEIGLLTSLEYVIFGKNRFHGTIPTEFGRLSNLSTVSLSGNALTGSIPSQMGLLKSATYVDLDFNQLTGTIPSELGLLAPYLSVALSLGDNPSLTGTLPTDLGRLTNLYDLNVANNRHTGRIPSEMGQLTSLGSLVLRNNSLTGNIPETLSALNASLYVVDVRANPFLSGTISGGLCTLDTDGCVPSSLIQCGLHSEEAQGFVCNGTRLCGCGCPCTNE